MNKIPRYSNEELNPIPYYFSKLELGIDEKPKKKLTKTLKKKHFRTVKRKSKLRRKIKTHRKSVG